MSSGNCGGSTIIGKSSLCDQSEDWFRQESSMNAKPENLTGVRGNLDAEQDINMGFNMSPHRMPINCNGEKIAIMQWKNHPPP